MANAGGQSPHPAPKCRLDFVGLEVFLERAGGLEPRTQRLQKRSFTDTQAEPKFGNGGRREGPGEFILKGVDVLLVRIGFAIDSCEEVCWRELLLITGGN